MRRDGDTMTPSRNIRQFFRVHVRLYIGVIAVLFVAQFFLSDGWWFLGLALVWGFVVFLHYMYIKSASIDDSWAERRAANVADKAYDAGHIDDIRDRYEGAGPARNAKTPGVRQPSNRSNDPSGGDPS